MRLDAIESDERVLSWQRPSHRPSFRCRVEQSSQVPQPPLAKRLELPRVERRYWRFERVEQTAPFGGYPRGDHSPVDRLAGPPREATVFQAVDEPSHVRVAYRRPLPYRA